MIRTSMSLLWSVCRSPGKYNQFLEWLFTDQYVVNSDQYIQFTMSVQSRIVWPTTRTAHTTTTKPLKKTCCLSRSPCLTWNYLCLFRRFPRPPRSRPTSLKSIKTDQSKLIDMTTGTEKIDYAF